MNQFIQITKPKYYQEWLVVFDNLKQNGVNDEIYNLCVSGTLEDRKFSIDKFKNELVETINIVLNKTINRFIQTSNLMFELNDIWGIKRKLIELKKNLKQVMFFKQLTFLENKFIEELSNSYLDNIHKFYNMFLDKVKEQIVDNENLYELYYVLKKNQF